MRTIFTLTASAALAIAAVAAAHDAPRDRGPGLAAVRDGEAYAYPAANFTSVALAGPAAADVRVGPAFSVRATGPEAALARLRIVVEDGGLRIEPRYSDRTTSEAEQAADRQVRFAITLPKLRSVALAGSGNLRIDRVADERFDLNLAGSGSVKLGALTVDHARVRIGGSGGVQVAGKVDALDVTLGGSGVLEATDLIAGRAAVRNAGSGKVRATVNGPATVRSAGSGLVDLGAGARCDVSRHGSGTVRCGG